jgi:thioredoxin 1
MALGKRRARTGRAAAEARRRRRAVTEKHGLAESEPGRSEIDELAGPVLLEFGTSWCGFCRAAQPLIARALGGHPAVRHIRIEDGSGRRLGRSFGVKLWPTLVFLRDGKEVERLVRPKDDAALAAAFAKIDLVA